MVIKFSERKNNIRKEFWFFFFVFIVTIITIVDVIEIKRLEDRVEINERLIEQRIDERLKIVHSYMMIISTYNTNLDSLFIYELANGIHEASQRHSLEPHLILTTIAHESMFDPKAEATTSNATGLGQIIPYHWGKKYNFVKADLFDWGFNLEITCKIINDMKKRHGRRKDWIAYYYSAEQPGRSNYFREWSRKNRYVKYLLKKHKVVGGKVWWDK